MRLFMRALPVFLILIVSGCPNPASQVEAPSFNPPDGTYTGEQTVTISAATPGAGIRYTLDGSTPSSIYGKQYEGIPISITSTTSIKAVAYKEGLLDSAVVGASYVLSGTSATPTVAPQGGTYSSTQYVTISTTTAGASIRYTTDGSEPTPTYGALYNGVALAIDTTTTVKAIA